MSRPSRPGGAARNDGPTITEMTVNRGQGIS
jgi:hypothetical protein